MSENNNNYLYSQILQTFQNISNDVNNQIQQRDDALRIEISAIREQLIHITQEYADFTHIEHETKRINEKQLELEDKIDKLIEENKYKGGANSVIKTIIIGLAGALLLQVVQTLTSSENDNSNVIEQDEQIVFHLLEEDNDSNTGRSQT